MAELKLHDKILNLASSATLAMAAQAKLLKDRGIKVVNLGTGEPDFLTPSIIVHAAQEALEKDVGHYTPVRGTDELLKAIAYKLHRDQQLVYEPKQIIATVGAKTAVAMALESLVGAGDEVIVFAPYWVSYPEQIKLTGAKPVVVEGRVSQGYLPSVEAFQRAISPKTKVVILNSPNNPSGAVYPRPLLEGIMALLKDTGIWVISDEIYEHLVFDGQKHISLATLSPDAYKRTLVISGCSKGYAMTGWRIGFAAGSAELVAGMAKLQSQRDTCLPGITQAAAAFALMEPKELTLEIEKMRKAYEIRRDRALEIIKDIGGVNCHRPKGAFYALLDIAEHLGYRKGGEPVEDDLTLAMRLLEEAHVAVVPGTPFGAPGTIRISLASSLSDIEEGLRRIAKWLA